MESVFAELPLKTEAAGMQTLEGEPEAPIRLARDARAELRRSLHWWQKWSMKKSTKDREVSVEDDVL